MLDYGDEKFAVLKVGEEEIVMSAADDISGSVFIEIDYDKVGIVDMKNDVKLV